MGSDIWRKLQDPEHAFHIRGRQRQHHGYVALTEWRCSVQHPEVAMVRDGEFEYAGLKCDTNRPPRLALWHYVRELLGLPTQSGRMGPAGWSNVAEPRFKEVDAVGKSSGRRFRRRHRRGMVGRWQSRLAVRQALWTAVRIRGLSLQD